MVSTHSPESRLSDPASCKLQADILAARPSCVHMSSAGSDSPPSRTRIVETVASLGPLCTSNDRRLVTESRVGWSKSIVGDISSPDTQDRVCVSSVAVIESRPADINGIRLSTIVPRISGIINYTNESILPSESMLLSATVDRRLIVVIAHSLVSLHIHDATVGFMPI